MNKHTNPNSSTCAKRTKRSASSRPTGSQMGRWLSDPLMTRAADRSAYDENRDMLLLLRALTGVLEDVKRALPGVDFMKLRASIQAHDDTPIGLDIEAMFRTLTENGKTFDEAVRVRTAIDPTFTLVTA